MLEGIIQPSERGLCYLSDVSPKDARFDRYKRQSETVSDQYFGTEFDRLSTRIRDCGNSLGFGMKPDSDTGEISFKLKHARFCRVRHCPVCQSRKNLMWASRVRDGIPRMLTDHPKIGFILLTLTVRNCQVEELRDTLAWMNESWKRLIQRAQFPAVGFVKSIEVTRSTSKAGNAHPHFHCLLALPSNYFVGRKYLNKQKWSEMWKSCLRVDYDPIVDVRVVRAKKGVDDPIAALTAGLIETIKYTVKPEDMTSDQEWFLELTRQLHKTRAIAVGGIFKGYLREEDPEDLISESDSIESSDFTLIFDWGIKVKKYVQKF